MANPNYKRLLQNIVLLLLTAVLIVFITTRNKSDSQEASKSHATLYDKSIGDDAKDIMIHAEGREDILLKKEGGIWKVVKPEAFIADKNKVRHLFTLLSENADSRYAIEGKDLKSYGLDIDRLSISFNGVKIIFGKLNDITRKRYVKKGNEMYLVEETISGLMEMGVDTFRPQTAPQTMLKSKLIPKPVTQ